MKLTIISKIVPRQYPARGHGLNIATVDIQIAFRFNRIGVGRAGPLRQFRDRDVEIKLPLRHIDDNPVAVANLGQRATRCGFGRHFGNRQPF